MKTQPKSEGKTKKKITITKIIVGVIVLSLVFGIVFLLSYKKDINVVNKIEPEIYRSLSCERNFQDEDYMIISKNAKKIKETIKASFYPNRLVDVYYKFIGNYDNEDIAASDATNMLAQYDDYVGGLGGNRSLYNPNHSSNGNIANFSMYAKASSITESTKAVLFFSEADDPESINIDSLRQNYEKRGFLCVENN